jgi:hypothetical protein
MFELVILFDFARKRKVSNRKENVTTWYCYLWSFGCLSKCTRKVYTVFCSKHSACVLWNLGDTCGNKVLFITWRKISFDTSFVFSIKVVKNLHLNTTQTLSLHSPN